MSDYQVSKQPHYEDACRNYAIKHNLAVLAEKLSIRPQVLRNKLNPEQPHQLNIPELMSLTDVTEDPSLVDGFLPQLHCLPCVPVNELADDKLQLYAHRATVEAGQIAACAVSEEKLTASREHSMVESVNSGIRYQSLAAMAMHARLQTNPAMNSVVDIDGLGSKRIRKKFATKGEALEYESYQLEQTKQKPWLAEKDDYHPLSELIEL